MVRGVKRAAPESIVSEVIYGRRNVDQFAAEWRPTRFFRVTFDPVAASGPACSKNKSRNLHSRARAEEDSGAAPGAIYFRYRSLQGNSIPFVREESAAGEVAAAEVGKERPNLSCASGRSRDVIRGIVQIVIGRIRIAKHDVPIFGVFELAIPRKSGRHLSRF